MGGPLTRRRPLAGLGAAVVLAAAALGYAYLRQPAQTAHLAGFTEGGVTVDIDLRGTGESGDLRVRLAPTQAGFHLYAITMPDGGVDGLGIPTRVSVSGGLQATGALASHSESIPLKISDLDVELPVYPDGPVEVRLRGGRRGAGVRPAPAPAPAPRHD